MKFSKLLNLIYQSQNLQKQFDKIQNNSNTEGLKKLSQNMDIFSNICQLLFVNKVITKCTAYAFSSIQQGYINNLLKGKYFKQDAQKAEKIKHYVVNNFTLHNIESPTYNMQKSFKECFQNTDIKEKLGTSQKYYNQMDNIQSYTSNEKIDPQCKEFYIFLNLQLKNNEPFFIGLNSTQNFKNINFLLPSSFSINNYGKKMEEIMKSKKLVGYKQKQLLMYMDKKNVSVINYIQKDIKPATIQFFNLLNKYCQTNPRKPLVKCKLQNVDIIPTIFDKCTNKIKNMFS